MSSQPKETKHTPARPLPIIGLGASAGGLEALDLFLRNVPAASGLAFVVVQHLDPTREGVLVELLQRATLMQVVQVKDLTRVRPDCVYVIPPNKDLSILRGVLHLLDPVAPREQRLPIDFFFRSLADDRRGSGVGVILSGMGRDGTLGIRAIKEQAGLVLVQEPASAKFDGMPRSAIDAGLADIVAPADELPARILEHLSRSPLVDNLLSPAGDDPARKSELEKVVILLRNQTGHDFSLYKRNTLYRRIERRMNLHRITGIGHYVRYLLHNPQETGLLFKELLIGVTGFFRDPEAWKHLRDEALPPLLAKEAAGRALRAWVPGCSTGEEAYSLAIVFKEAMERVNTPDKFLLQIFATDLDPDAVDKARQGVFPATIGTAVSPRRLKQFFTKEERGYRVIREIREMVVFAPHNLIMDPPFSRLDILCCRNLLIYLGPELQERLFPLFHHSLNPGGVLFLGSAESIGGFERLFNPLHGKSRIYRRQDSAEVAVLTSFPTAIPPDKTKACPVPPLLANLSAQAERWLLQHHAPVAVLVNDLGDILFINGRSGRYLEPAAGKAHWNIFVMAREELRYELTSSFQAARRQKEPVTVHSLKVCGNGVPHFVDITVQFLEKPETLCGLAMVVFTEVAAPAPVAKGRAAKTPSRGHEEELQQARDEAQRTREETQAAQEELKSANEELQSANEELTTSKEEMQSLNEELQTVNAELQAKVDELTAASNDIKNLLNSTEIATVFLDNELRVRRFTEQVAKIIKLIPGDVGRPVTDLASDLLDLDLAADSQEVLRTLATVEKPLATRDGRWFAMRLMPYCTLDNRIDGVVITFTDITTTKKLEAKLQARGRAKKGARR